MAKNYLSFARVLHRSFREHHPQAPFYLLLGDEVDGCFDPAAEPFELLRLDDLGISPLPPYRFRYSRPELVVAPKPHLLRYLLDCGFDWAVFLDADILVLDDLTPLWTPARGGSIVLTPHLLKPLSGGERAARELTILKSGVYNAGFVAVSNSPGARAFLTWWQDRLELHCRRDLAAGMHLDQRWLDLVPAFFEDLSIVRDPGSNVAYWNLPERAVEMSGERLRVAGRPCRFFHFSGFSPDRPEAVTRHVAGLKTADIGPAARLFERYAGELESAGFHETKSWPYAYGSFDNGVPIPDVAREEYQELGIAAESFGDPFGAVAADSFFNWLAGAAQEAPDGKRTISRLWEAVYRRRPDVQRAFPDHRGADRDAFLDWTIRSGASEHGIPDCFRS